MYSNKKTKQIEQTNLSEKDNFLEFLNLNKNYIDGKKDWLYYKKDKKKKKKVLDVVGSFGVNLLGHKNPILKQYAKELPYFRPAFIQVSKNTELNILSNHLTEQISQHTDKKKWQCEYANTGTEIIEVAIKIAWLNYKEKLDKVKQEIYYSINVLKSSNKDIKLQAKLEQLLIQLDTEKYLLHFEGSFHGKTLGALSLLGNDLKVDFEVKKTISCSLEVAKFQTVLSNLEIKYTIINPRTNRLTEKKILPVVGLFIEPIQGEAGVIPIPNNIIQIIASHQKNNALLVISDEIQCGLWRTGYFSALSSSLLVADIYCFGKSLGAGISKISSLICKDEKYPKKLLEYHSSTFGEDYYSTWVANKFFEQIQDNQSKIELIKTNWIYNKLKQFQKQNTDVIKDIRGKGNMLAIEMNMAIFDKSFITKYFDDLDKLGYLVSSILLNNENIRILPTLSNPYTFRFQPSIYFTQKELDFFFLGFQNFINAIRKKNLNYLFGRIVPLTSQPKLNSTPFKNQTVQIPKNAAVFICHPIDTNHMKDIIQLTKGFSNNELSKINIQLIDFQEFSIYHIGKLTNNKGKIIDIVFLGIPLTSETFYEGIKGGNRSKIIAKIQNAVDYANKFHAKSIGLGQYTSIITRNGLTLQSDKAILTTGNAYTAGLSIEALEKTILSKNKKHSELSIGIIGAAGNIISVIAEILIPKFKSSVLIYNANPENCKKTQNKFIAFLKKVHSSSNSPLKSILNEIQLDSNYTQVVAQLDKQCFASNDIEKVKDCDIIVIGTNSTKVILETSHVKEGGIILDLSVPSNTSLELQNREDSTFLKGGIVQLPIFNQKHQHIQSSIIPLDIGEAFACMAETFGLTFGNSDKHQIGDLSKKQVETTLKMMKSHGFTLGRLKMKSSL